jgi:hypothetical protein
LSLGYAAYLPISYRKEAPLIHFFKWFVSEIVLLSRVVLFTLVVSAASRPLMAVPTSFFSTYHIGWRVGRASWYGPGFFHRFRADGKRYHKNEVFVASRSLAPGTMIYVINLSNRRSIDRLVVADRMPRNSSREFDFSARAAEILDMKDAGIVPVAYLIRMEH